MKIAFSSFAEIGLIFIAAALTSTILGGGLVWGVLLSLEVNPIYALLVAGLIIVVIAFAALANRRRFSVVIPKGISISRVIVPLAAYILFFLLSGAILYLLVASSAQPAKLTLIAAIAINAASWVAGFITPGAPGGIGVREAVLVSVLHPFDLGGEALVIAAELRIISTLGDFTFFAATRLLAALMKGDQPLDP